MDEETKALREQIQALTRAVQALTGSRAEPTGSLGDGSLAKLCELHIASWAPGVTWKLSRESALAPAVEHFGDRPARSLTRQDWLHFRDKVRARQITKRKRVPEPTTLNQETFYWRHVYTWAIAEGLLVTNPLTGIKPVRAKKHRQTEPTADDVRALRPFLDASGWAFTLLGFRRGLRAKEARGLEWRNVDLETGRVRFTAAKSYKATEVIVPSDVVEALRAIRPDVPPRYVFQSPVRKGPMNAVTMWRKVREAADAAGLEAADGDRRVVFHDMRHGFTSGLARKLPLAVTMRMSRHTSIRSAARYIHVNEDDLAQANAVLEDGARKPAHRVSTEDPVNKRRKHETIP